MTDKPNTPPPTPEQIEAAKKAHDDTIAKRKEAMEKAKGGSNAT